MTDSESPIVGNCPHLSFGKGALACCDLHGPGQPDVCQEYPFPEMDDGMCERELKIAGLWTEYRFENGRVKPYDQRGKLIDYDFKGRVLMKNAKLTKKIVSDHNAMLAALQMIARGFNTPQETRKVAKKLKVDYTEALEMNYLKIFCQAEKASRKIKQIKLEG